MEILKSYLKKKKGQEKKKWGCVLLSIFRAWEVLQRCFILV